MRSYLFFNEEGLVPPPAEYVRFTQERRLWQEIGWRMGEHTKQEEESALIFMRLEDERRKLERK